MLVLLVLVVFGVAATACRRVGVVVGFGLMLSYVGVCCGCCLLFVLMFFFAAVVDVVVCCCLLRLLFVGV